MVLLKSVFVFCATIYVVSAKNEQYDGSSVYDVYVKNANEAKFFNGLENEIPIDIWTYAMPGRAGQVLVPKDYKYQFEMTLSAAEVEYKIQVENIKGQLDLEEERLASRAVRRSNSSRFTPALPYDVIPDFNVVDQYLTRLANAYPNVVTVASAGKSFEGRDMKYLKISTTNFQNSRKPVIFIQSLLHAREWVTLPAALYAIEKLVIDVTERDLVNDIDWIILPVANPDGYQFSHSNSRFWRKNRATGFITGNICMGVDLNRNYDIFWGTASSSNVCTDTFHGRNAFSEPETQNIRRILQEHKDRMELFIDLHSFGSLILFGYGNGELPGNALAINYIGVNMAQAIDRVKWRQNPNYVVGNTFHLLYAASGGSSDYAQAIGVPFSYTYELPAYRNINNQLNGFLVEPEFIEQAGYETWEGIKVGARIARDSFRLRSTK